MSVVKNKINTETETETTINNKRLRPHITENIGLIEQQKILMIRDAGRASQEAHIAKKNKQTKNTAIKPTLH